MSRRRLIEAAIELLATGGYSAASLAAIGQRAGLSRGMVTHYFGTKEQCMREVLQYIQDSSRVALAGFGEARGLTRLETIVRLYLREGSAYSRFARALHSVQVEALTGTPSLAEDVARSHGWLHAVLTETIAQAASDSEASGELDPAEAATVVSGTLRGLLVQALVDEGIDRRESVDLAWHAVRSVVGAH